MLTIYIGDARNVIKRVRTDHCSSNVEASALRKHVAQAIGYEFARTKRTSGSTRLRLDLDDPRQGEQAISSYLRSGSWKYVLCQTYDEAHDFQWYAIAQLQPVLNVDRREWDYRLEKRYEQLLHQLKISPGFMYSQLAGQKTGPGVYMLYHKLLPGQITQLANISED